RTRAARLSASSSSAPREHPSRTATYAPPTTARSSDPRSKPSSPPCTRHKRSARGSHTFRTSTDCETRRATILSAVEIEEPSPSSDPAVEIAPAEERHPSRLINREASWLDFDERILALANQRSLPVLERAKFFAIFSDNLDEFFQV